MKHVKKSASWLATLVLGLGLVTVSADAQYTGPTAGQKVAFLGDSITQFGIRPGGYVTLVAQALEQNGNKVEVIPAGVSGNTSKNMLARLNKDVLSKKPDWMTLSCGVNDVWHGAKGVPLDQYQGNITSIVDQATAAGIKVVILTSTMIGEDQANANNQKLVAYNDFLHSLAAQKHLPIADLNADMQASLAEQKARTPNLKNELTVDGVHPNALGNQVMATGVLKAFGFTDAQLAQAKEAWDKNAQAPSTPPPAPAKP
jgi:lysophospholipase L1-like esterase